jgi:hypothetical protein
MNHEKRRFYSDKVRPINLAIKLNDILDHLKCLFVVLGEFVVLFHPAVQIASVDQIVNVMLKIYVVLNALAIINKNL